MRHVPLAPALCVLLAACGPADREPPGPPRSADEPTLTEGPLTVALTSPAFATAGEIPARYTCDGAELSPPLAWRGLPAGTRSLALVVDDPDAPDPAKPRYRWVHWVVYNLPVPSDGLLEGAASRLPAGAREGRNDGKETGYRGPCPPVGRHRYFHKLYALDTVLPDLRSPTRAELEAAMRGHVLARGELVGTYRRAAPAGPDRR